MAVVDSQLRPTPEFIAGKAAGVLMDSVIHRAPEELRALVRTVFGDFVVEVSQSSDHTAETARYAQGMRYGYEDVPEGVSS
jgi:hypothetical protein